MNIVSTSANYGTIKLTDPSDWKCEVVRGMVFRPEKGKEPNAFHRWMQELAFGVKWTKTTSTMAD